MAVPKNTIWSLDPHTLAKHEILRRYLQCWFPILNTYHGRIFYIDGFCGPGRYSRGEIGSPIIALDVAATHQKALGGEIVFWFIDEREDRINHLRSELKQISIPSHFKVHADSGDFREKLEALLNRIDQDKERDANNRVQYFLFFASNHPLGHVKMKEAMWATDADGNFRFSDATNPLQSVLFEADFTAPLWAILHGRFAGQEVLTDRILEFVNDETAFLGKHLKATLKKHLDEVQPPERILVRATKADGKKWRRGSFPPGVFVTFPPPQT